MSKRRERRAPDPGEFSDPLNDYSGQDFADDFERSLFEDSMDAITSSPFTSVTQETSIREVISRMAEQNFSCVVVTDADNRPVGVLSEQDVSQRVAERFEQVADQPVSTVMTRDPIVVHDSDSPARAVNLMGSGYFRHLPVCDMDDKLIGIIGARRLTAYLQQFAEVP